MLLHFCVFVCAELMDLLTEHLGIPEDSAATATTQLAKDRLDTVQMFEGLQEQDVGNYFEETAHEKAVSKWLKAKKGKQQQTKGEQPIRVS